MQNNINNALNIAFIGGGNMASALIGGMLGRIASADAIHVVDVNPESLQRLQQQFGVRTSTQIDDALRAANVIVLAVKPQQLRQVLAQVKPFLNGQLLISIAAGIRASDMSRWLGAYDAIVRCMPNTPALIGKGVTGMVALAGVSAVQRQQADQLMSAVGQTVWLEQEAQLDVVTAVSGSGPAYVFYFMEAMQQAAQGLGLTPEQARLLTLSTFTGASELAAQSTESVSVLRERVTSKGGTTYAALTSMAASGVPQAIIRAVEAAAARGHEMGEELGGEV